MAKKENGSKAKKHFFKDFKAELKKVIWPTPKQLINNTIAVATIVLLTAIIVFVLDVIFDMGNKYGISRLQSIVSEKYNKDENNDNTDSEKENSEGEDNSTEEENSTENTSDTAESNSETDSPENKTTEDGEQANTEQ